MSGHLSRSYSQNILFLSYLSTPQIQPICPLSLSFQVLLSNALCPTSLIRAQGNSKPTVSSDFQYTVITSRRKTIGEKRRREVSCKSRQKCPLCKVMRSLLEAAGRYFTVTMAVNSQDSVLNYIVSFAIIDNDIVQFCQLTRQRPQLFKYCTALLSLCIIVQFCQLQDSVTHCASIVKNKAMSTVQVLCIIVFYALSIMHSKAHNLCYRYPTMPSFKIKATNIK